ncbi:unnamed protein product [Rotaria sp. Silwood1]|nr:unnamed protein product [Rotaria sp. Silwood1]CAF4905605.1 unnamed protein product [Rotaria sp. Silwood1]CAF4918309.1 unnamed protein product [Rotaria sp. Silwood1]CAF5091181.1 unnamed protein product [Rotaria sp. Silwood1]
MYVGYTSSNNITRTSSQITTSRTNKYIEPRTRRNIGSHEMFDNDADQYEFASKSYVFMLITILFVLADGAFNNYSTPQNVTITSATDLQPIIFNGINLIDTEPPIEPTAMICSTIRKLYSSDEIRNGIPFDE